MTAPVPSRGAEALRDPPPSIRLLTCFASWTSRLGRIGLWIAIIAMAALAILVNFEIVSRSIFHRSTLIADEYGSYLFIVTTVFGFSYALDNGFFLRVDMGYQRLQPRIRALVLLFSSVLGILLTLVCAFEMAQLAWDSLRFGSRSSTASATPLVYPQALLAIGLVMLGLSFLRQAALAAIGLMEPRELPTNP